MSTVNGVAATAQKGTVSPHGISKIKRKFVKVLEKYFKYRNKTKYCYVLLKKTPKTNKQKTPKQNNPPP